MTDPPADSESAPADAGEGDASPSRIRPFLDSPSVAQAVTADDGGLDRGLRPFVLTSGRVSASDPDIGLETQVSTRARGSLIPLPRLSTELRAIVDLCIQPLSVAEISARLRLHLGVAKILVGDLKAAGYLDIHLVDVSSAHDPDTILRVMRGLRAIS